MKLPIAQQWFLVGLLALCSHPSSADPSSQDVLVWGVPLEGAAVASLRTEDVEAYAIPIAERFAEARFGERFYRAHVARDASSVPVLWSRYKTPLEQVCRVGFLLTPPCDASQSLYVTVTVSSTGEVVSSFGVPDCTMTPEECVFRVSRAEAFAIARRAGLQGHEKEWRAALDWYDFGDQLTYAWRVTRLREDASDPWKQWDSVIIDVNDGRIGATNFRADR